MHNQRVCKVAGYAIAVAIVVAVASLLVVGLAWAEGEIVMSGLLKVSNGEFDLQRATGNNSYDQTGRSGSFVVQSIGTGTHELITIAADVSTNGSSWFKNITTNTDRYVDIGVQDSNAVFIAMSRLEATRWALIPLHPTNHIYALAYVGAVYLEAWVNED